MRAVTECDECGGSVDVRTPVKFKDDRRASAVLHLCTACREDPSAAWQKRFLPIPGERRSRQGGRSEGPIRGPLTAAVRFFPPTPESRKGADHAKNR